MLIMLTFYFQLLVLMIGKVLQIKLGYYPNIIHSSVNLDQIHMEPKIFI